MAEYLRLMNGTYIPVNFHLTYVSKQFKNVILFHAGFISLKVIALENRFPYANATQ